MTEKIQTVYKYAARERDKKVMWIELDKKRSNGEIGE
jgi:hypothetical protein